MNFTFVPTLEHAALVKTAVILWNQDNIRSLLATFDFHSSFQHSKQNEWQKIEDMVAKKVPELQLAASLGKKLRETIEPVGLQMLKWQTYHVREDLCLGLHLPTDFSWTVQGTINYKETAKQLIKDENLDKFERYRLACINCLEEDIGMLWGRLPETVKYDFCEGQLVNRNPIITYWSDILIGKIAPHIPEAIELQKDILWLYAFEHAAVKSFNIEATKYFFRTLSPAVSDFPVFIAIKILHIVRNSISESSVGFIEECSCVLFFLLSQMDREQQMEIIRAYALEVLFCYLMWPMQSLFVEAADQLWDFLDEKKYLLILMAICNRVTAGLKDHNYKELLYDLWQHSPYRFVIHIVNNCGKKKFSLSRLYEHGDRSLLKLFQKDLPDVYEKINVANDKTQKI